jgi:hypothetical protein
VPYIPMQAKLVSLCLPRSCQSASLWRVCQTHLLHLHEYLQPLSTRAVLPLPHEDPSEEVRGVRLAQGRAHGRTRDVGVRLSSSLVPCFLLPASLPSLADLSKLFNPLFCAKRFAIAQRVCLSPRLVDSLTPTSTCHFLAFSQSSNLPVGSAPSDIVSSYLVRRGVNSGGRKRREREMR